MKKLFKGIIAYLYVTGVLLIPVLLVLIGFDFIYDLELQFFSDNSILRIIFFIWFLIVNIAYIYTEHKEVIKKIL